MVRYSLSKRQQKLVYKEEKELRIAIPAPPEEVDIEKYFLDHVEFDRDTLIEAYEFELTVAPKGGPQGSLNDHVGTIITNDDFDGFVICIPAIIGVLATGKGFTRYPTQWAGGEYIVERDEE